MRIENAKVKITIPIPIGKPDGNGVRYTKESIEAAIKNTPKFLPILYKKDAETEESVVGITTQKPRSNVDPSGTVCNLIIDGLLFYSGAEIVINDVVDGAVSSFEIKSIGITT